MYFRKSSAGEVWRIGGAGRGGGQTVNRSPMARPGITISESSGVM